MKQVSEAAAAALCRHWQEGWNALDLDTIMAPFAANVVFSSPFVPVLTGDDTRTSIEGFDALRAYVAAALERAPNVDYAVDGLYAGSDSIVIAYTCSYPDRPDKRGADLMRVDADGKIVEWYCHYE